MKIGFLITIDPDTSGGIFQYAMAMLEALQKLNTNKFILIVFTYNKKIISSKYKVEIREINKPNQTIKEKFKRILFLITDNDFLRKTIKISSIEKYHDIDFFISPFINPYPAIYLNKKLIFTLHDLQFKRLPQFFPIHKRIYFHLILKKLCDYCNSIICEAPSVKKDIEFFYKVESEKIKIIPSPPILKKEKNKKYSTKFSMFHKKRYIFYPANSWEHKNHIRLIKAFRLINKNDNDIYLFLTGTKSSYYKNICKQIKKYNLHKKVIHFGRVNEIELINFYLNADLLVIPSLFESISIPIYEAFDLGIPVCCADSGSMKWQVKDAGLIFNPYNIDEIVNAIKRLLYNPEEKFRLIKNGKKIIKKNDFTKYSKQLEKTLENID